MRHLEKPTALLAVLLSLAACTPLASGPSSSSPGADEAAIRAAGDAWNNAYDTLNVDALVALYAPDAVLMPEAALTAKGEAAIRGFLLVHVGLFKEGAYKPAIAKAVEIEVSGNLGMRSGTYSVTNQSGAVVDTGKWLETWRKSNGKWHITRDIWNSDMLPLFPPNAYPGYKPPAG